MMAGRFHLPYPVQLDEDAGRAGLEAVVAVVGARVGQQLGGVDLAELALPGLHAEVADDALGLLAVRDGRLLVLVRLLAALLVFCGE